MYENSISSFAPNFESIETSLIFFATEMGQSYLYSGTIAGAKKDQNENRWCEKLFSSPSQRCMMRPADRVGGVIGVIPGVPEP